MTDIYLFALSAGERVDLLVDKINAWSPAVWLAITGYAIYFTYKELKDYTKNSEPKIQEVNDILDERTFEKSAMPLMIQLDSQVVDYARAEYVTALEANGAPFEDPIEKYEEVRSKSLREMDISSVSQALQLTESLREASKAADRKKSSRRLYSAIHVILKIAFAILSLNIVAGLTLIVTSIAYSDNDSSRYAFIVWTILALISLLLGLGYALANIALDPYRKRRV